MTSATAISSDKLLFFVGINTGFVRDGLPDERYVDFYRKRCSSELHCAIIGNVVIPGGHGTNKGTPMLTRDQIWVEVAESIRAGGSLPGIQLATAWKDYCGSRKFVARSGHEVIKQAQFLVQNLGTDAIEKVLDSFDDAGALAVEHGFGHIQIHAAHGYLPGLLIDDRINPDAIRVRERLAKLSQRLRSQQVETSIRLSLKTGDHSFDRCGADLFLNSTIALPFDYIDLSSGFYNIDKRLIYPSRPEIIEGRYRESLVIANRHPNRLFIISGRMMGRSENLPRNVHIGVCRDLVANPAFLSEPGNGCRNYNKCHYYSRGEDHVICPRWVEL